MEDKENNKEINKEINNKYFNIWSFSLLILFFLISVFFLFLILPKSFLPSHTFEVYIQDGDYYKSSENDIDIFIKDAYSKKLVHPLTRGSYSFAIYNSSEEKNLPYDLEFHGENLDDIPLVFSLKRNDDYIFGGKEIYEKRPLREISLVTIKLDGRTTDIYKLEWAWDTNTDEMDTFIGNIQESQLFNLTIKAKGLSDFGRITKLDDDIHLEYVGLVKYFILIILLLLIIFIIIAFITKKIKKKPLKEIFRNVILILLSAFFIINIYNLYKTFTSKDQLTTMFGYGGAVVLTGSMEPTIQAGDLIIIKEQEEYYKGDIVSYRGNTTAVTHRIVDVTDEGFIITGDANNKEDGVIEKDKIIGKVIRILPNFHQVLKVINNPFIIMAILGVFFYIYRIIPLTKIDNEELEDTDFDLENIDLEEYLNMEEEPDVEEKLPAVRYLLYLIMLTTIVSSVSFSKFKTTEETINQAKVAKFNVEISHNDWSIDEYNDFALLDLGEERKFEFDIKNNSEVAVKIRVMNAKNNNVLDTNLYKFYDKSNNLLSPDNNGWVIMEPSGQTINELTIKGALKVEGLINEIEFYLEYEQFI